MLIQAEAVEVKENLAVCFVQEIFRDFGMRGDDAKRIMTFMDLLQSCNEHLVLKPVRSDQTNVDTVTVLFRSHLLVR